MDDNMADQIYRKRVLVVINKVFPKAHETLLKELCASMK